MRFATVDYGAGPRVAVVREGRFLKLEHGELGFGLLDEIAASGTDGLRRIRAWVERQPEDAYRSLEGIEFRPAVPDPRAIYTIGHNYRTPGEVDGAGPERPLVYAKVPTSVAGHGAILTWDRSLTPNVDPEVELGVVIGAQASNVSPGDALRHVFGYTCVNDVSSRDPWLDGDQWLLGKSMPGFCPVGPWIVTADELDPDGLRIGCRLNGVAIQEGSTADMRFRVPEIVSFLSRHLTLSPGDLIATGTPARLPGPLGPDRHLEAGDVVTSWIEGIGELTTTVA